MRFHRFNSAENHFIVCSVNSLEVAMRLHSEPWVGVPDKKLARFIVDCWVKPIEELPRATVRWKKADRWGKQGPAWVAIAQSCKVVED